MHCTHCGLCCEETEMLLSEEDTQLLEKTGHDRHKFVRYDEHGYARLRNRKGYCVFYDAERRRCRVYRHRPLGCRIYPTVYSEEDGTIADELCPMSRTVLQAELDRNGKKVIRLLERIDLEAATRT